MIETVVLAVCLSLLLLSLRMWTAPRSGRSRHSFVYRHYIDNRSTLWRFRRWQWYVTSRRRCAKCNCKVSLHRGNWRRRPVAQFHPSPIYAPQPAIPATSWKGYPDASAVMPTQDPTLMGTTSSWTDQPDNWVNYASNCEQGVAPAAYRVITWWGLYAVGTHNGCVR